MFDSEAAIRAWRAELNAAGLAASVVQELEEHLREDFERQIAAGMDAAQAFHAARARMGTPAELDREFALIGPRGFVATLRRHGWKLALCAAIGLTAALLLPLVRPATAQSEAKLLLRYVVDVAPLDTPATVRRMPLLVSPERAAYMDEQMEILSSSILAERVATAIGARKLLAGAGGGDDLARAALLINEGLTVRTTKNSSIIRMSFHHPDAALLQGVLREVIQQYLQLIAAKRAPPDSGSAPVPRISNVSLIQAPSPPYVNSAPLLRIQATFIGAGVLIGLLWLLLLQFTHSGLKLAR